MKMVQSDILDGNQETPAGMGVEDEGWKYLNGAFGKNSEIDLKLWNRTQLDLMSELGINYEGKCEIDVFRKIYDNCCPAIKVQCVILDAKIKKDNNDPEKGKNLKIGSPYLLTCEIMNMFAKMFPQCVNQFCVEGILEEFYSNYKFTDKEKAGIRDASLIKTSSPPQYHEFITNGLPGRNIDKVALIDEIKGKGTEYLKDINNQRRILNLAKQQVLTNFLGKMSVLSDLAQAA